MRNPDEAPETVETTGEPQIRSAFLRDEVQLAHWADDFMPELEAEDPATHGLAEALWKETRQFLEDRHERLSRQIFHTALERATSEVFANADVGIKQLAAAKKALQERWPEIERACQYRPAALAPKRERPAEHPVLTARLETTPAKELARAPGSARLCLSLGDYGLTLELNVPPQSWLYRAYRQLNERIMAMVAESRRPQEQPMGRLGGVTEDRELTVGLRYVRQPISVVEVGTFRSRKGA